MRRTGPVEHPDVEAGLALTVKALKADDPESALAAAFRTVVYLRQAIEESDQ